MKVQRGIYLLDLIRLKAPSYRLIPYFCWTYPLDWVRLLLKAEVES